MDKRMSLVTQKGHALSGSCWLELSAMDSEAMNAGQAWQAMCHPRCSSHTDVAQWRIMSQEWTQSEDCRTGIQRLLLCSVDKHDCLK